MMTMSIDLPDALSPQTRHTAEVFVDELDEFESAADDVVVVFDEAGEKGWASAMKKDEICLDYSKVSVKSFSWFMAESCNETDNWK